MEKRDSSVKAPAVLSSGLKGSICAKYQIVSFLGVRRRRKLTFHLSISSVSHGFSFLCVDGIVSCGCS